jgi:hypothetical protein
METKIFWILPLLAFIYVIYAESRPKDSLAESRAVGVNARYLLAGVILTCAIVSLVIA